MKISIALQIFCSIITVLLFACEAKSQDNFREIIPLVTTRAEVEKKLGKENEFGRYEFDEGRVYVHYRENACLKTNRNCFCLAPLGTVLEVSFQPYKDIYVKDLKLDPNLFKKSEVVGGHVEGITVYVNEKAGIVYEVQDEIVTRIGYSESEETCQMLEQKATRKQKK